MNDDNNLKPAIVLWIRPDEIMKMSNGVLPISWKLENPNKDLDEKYKHAQVIVPCDYFAILWDKKVELEKQTDDLPF